MPDSINIWWINDVELAGTMHLEQLIHRNQQMKTVYWNYQILRKVGANRLSSSSWLFPEVRWGPNANNPDNNHKYRQTARQIDTEIAQVRLR